MKKYIVLVFCLIALMVYGGAVLADQPDGMTRFTSLFIGDAEDDPDVTPGDDDIYVKGTMEVDGSAYFDGALDFDGDFSVGGVAGATIGIGDDDTVADDIDIGSAKDDVLISGEDITFDTADDANFLVYDDLAFTMETAAGAWSVENTAGGVMSIAADDTVADDVNIGSAKDDVDIAGEDIALTSADDIAITSSTAAGILNLMTGTSGGVVNLCTDDTAADTINIGSAKDALTINSVQFDVSANDVTLAADSTGGNALAKNEFVGLPRIMNVGIGTMANGTTNTVITDIGDSETPATDWTAIDADTTMSNDSTYYRQGTASLKMVLGASAAATDGCTNALGSGDQDWSDDESVGMWVYADTTFDADDLNFVILDGGTDSAVQFPAYTTANTWQWMEVNISGVANGDKDVITDVSIELNAGSDLISSEASLYFDFIVKWDVAEEEALGQAIVQDGVMSLTVIDATDAGASCANLTLYTDYFVHYQSGNDAVVMITDQSNADKVGLALIAY